MMSKIILKFYFVFVFVINNIVIFSFILQLIKINFLRKI